MYNSRSHSSNLNTSMRKGSVGKQQEKLRVSNDPYLSKGFGIRLGSVYQQKPYNARELIVNRVRNNDTPESLRRKNFIQENIDLINSGQQAPSRIKPENHENNPHYKVIYGDGGEIM